jgi:predicted nucleic acid-binding protein
MTARCFVDSNVIVYARDLTDPQKQERATLWIEVLASAGAGRLSHQVLVEAYSALTHAHRQLMDRSAARKYIANFRYWYPLAVNLEIIEAAWRAQDRFGFNWWDCLIVAAARIAECKYLLTEDLQHGQDLDGLVVVNPFEVAPNEVH